MSRVAVNVLKSVLIADGGHYGREIVAGTLDEIPEGLFADLNSAAYVEAADGAQLRQDGPTIAEFVAAGYLAANYPPAGYASRSTAEEITAAIEARKAGQSGAGDDAQKKAAEDAAKARAALEAELAKLTVAQLRDRAAAEKIDVGDDDKKAELIDKIAAAIVAAQA